jgi:NAD-dependent deacetylase
MLGVVDRFVELLSKSKRVLVFTGAGISTASGIPDFRGPQGVWTKRQPVYYDDFLASEEARIEHWDYKLEGWEGFKNAKPNPAHLALVRLEKLGKLELLVTQNIDGLHQAAGHSKEKVVELHGTNLEVECLSCGARSDPEPAFAYFRKEKKCPRCSCGGLLKTATVSFGQPMPQEPLRRAYEAAKRADLVVSIGSTLSVQPAASVPLRAVQRYVPYVIVNRGATEQDGLATLRFEADAAELLPKVIGKLVTVTN